MSAWSTQEMATALPDVNHPIPSIETDAGNDGVPKNPQQHGWTTKTGYDYETYNKSSKDQLDTPVAAAEVDDANATLPVGLPDVGIMGVESGTWASNAPIYEWDEEYGDVGPSVEKLEQLLFQGEFTMRTGIEFKNIAAIDVVQEGNVQLQPIRQFEDAGLHPVMLANIKLCGYTTPTPIQQYCLPAVFKGHDVVACAQTGSGKTAAFLIPILSKLMGKAKKLAAPRPNPATYVHGVTPAVRAEPLVLIVCPSRELATQIFNEARKFCYRSMLRPAVVYGGGPIAEQIASLSKGCDLLIGTPGRLGDFINRPHILTLKRLKYMVIDEADEMLHSDWETELKHIMSGGDQEEGNIKYLMFSATFPKECRDLAKEHLAHDHVRIRVGRAGSTHKNIKQDVVFVEPHMKRKCLEDLLLSTPPARTIIFVNSKKTADEIDDFLFNKSFPCVSIHGDRTQREREDCIRAFRNGKMPILIATGVSARGLDIFHVMHVINFDLPSNQYGGIEEYTHRIGRTGRIGNMGLATSFYNSRDEDLGEALTKTLLETRQVIPDFLEEHIPEGFTADGTGDPTLLHFEADSDDGQDDENAESGEAVDGGAWGAAPTGDAPVWGAAAPAEPAAWGAPAEATQPAAAVSRDEWGSTRPVVSPALQQPALPVQQYAPAPTQQFAPPPAAVTSQGYGAPPAQQYAPAPPQQFAPYPAPQFIHAPVPSGLAAQFGAFKSQQQAAPPQQASTPVFQHQVPAAALGWGATQAQALAATADSWGASSPANASTPTW